jgi:hypothetical protein
MPPLFSLTTVGELDICFGHGSGAVTTLSQGELSEVIMKQKIIKALILLFVAILPASLLTFRDVSAHNRAVHQKSTDTAYCIMRVAESKSLRKEILSKPAEVPASQQQDWDDFITRMGKAAHWYRSLPSKLPAPGSLVCPFAIGDGLTNSISQAQASAMSGPLGSVPFNVSLDYLSGSSCGFSSEAYHPGGIFDNLSSDYTGNVLGLWTADVDTHENDTHMWLRPTNLPGIQQLKDGADDAYKAGATSLLVPVYCAAKCIAAFFGFGDCDDCIKGAEDFIDSHDPVKALDNIVPGIGDFSSSLFVGLWHHIKGYGPHSNTYDVYQGYFGDEAFNGFPGPSELVTTAISDAVGLSVKPGDSEGVAKYQIYGANDGHPDSVHRSDEDWKWTTWPHVPFSPVDNLGFYGWAQFRDQTAHPVNFLGYPLHAIDDASTSPHMAGTFGWGHEPFEAAEYELWPTTMYHSYQAEQKRQIGRIVLNAYKKYRDIEQWRQEYGNTADVPLRILTNDLATYTNDLIAASSSSPFSFIASELKLTGSDDMARKIYTSDATLLAEVIRPATEMALAIKIAFLLAAAETVAPKEVQP